ncbi:MAG TPA: hypothetical protein VF739_04420 [Ktedonobacterales bacterium]
MAVPANKPVRNDRLLRRLSLTMLFLLLLQYIVGMVVNFWAAVPDQHPGAHPANYFVGAAQSVWWALSASGLAPLILHATLGAILGILSVVTLVYGILRRTRLWVTVTVLGWLGVFSAGFNGASFLNYGEDFSSMIMSVAFLVALMAYALGLYYSKPAS